MTATRDQIVEATCRLLEVQGYQATGLNEIVRQSGAPKGSLYYHFPQGKEQLVAEAVERTGRLVADRIRSSLAEVDSAGEAVARFVLTLAHHVEASDFRRGGPITTAALEAASTSDRVRQACLAAYASWRQAFEDRLVRGGHEPMRSVRLATIIIAALEGAIILSRTERSTAPLVDVAEELATWISTDN